MINQYELIHLVYVCMIKAKHKDDDERLITLK